MVGAATVRIAPEVRCRDIADGAAGRESGDILRSRLASGCWWPPSQLTSDAAPTVSLPCEQLGRLEHGAFRWSPIFDSVMRWSAPQLAALVDGHKPYCWPDNYHAGAFLQYQLHDRYKKLRPEIILL